MIFYKETDFQETEIGKIPKEWEVAKLKDTCELIRGTEPGSKTYNKEGKGFKFIRVSDISKQILETVFVDEKPENLVFCHKENVLLALDGVPGIVAKGMEGAISSGIRIVKPANKIDNDFLFYILQHSIVQKVIMNYTTGTTIKHASRAVDFITLPLPPLGEQQKIAEILSTVDKAIQKTDEVIAKTERLKKGLMQTLLTRGIGHKEFKDTEIGRIPKEWKVVGLGDENVAEIRSNKRISGFKRVAFIPMELIPESSIFTKYEIRSIEEVKSFTYCEKGDLLLAKITPCLENGKQGLVPDDVPNSFALATTEVFPILCKGIDKLFLFYILKFSKFRNKIIASMTGTTGRQRAPKESVEKLQVPLPPLPEQRQIAEILSTMDKKLELERNERARLERIKRGLMDLLLTGKVRVRV